MGKYPVSSADFPQCLKIVPTFEEILCKKQNKKTKIAEFQVVVSCYLIHNLSFKGEVPHCLNLEVLFFNYFFTLSLSIKDPSAEVEGNFLPVSRSSQPQQRQCHGPCVH